MEGQTLVGQAQHPLPTRGERGSGGHLRLGQPASQPIPRRPLRRGVQLVVRQGARSGPQHGRAPPRQRLRRFPARRRLGRRRRRPRLQVFHPAPPDRAQLHRRVHAGAVPRQCPRAPGLGHLRLGAVALQRLLGGPEGRYGKPGLRHFRRAGPAPGEHRHSRRL